MFCLIPDDITSIYLNIVFGNSSDFHFNGHKTININLKNNAGGSGLVFVILKSKWNTLVNTNICSKFFSYIVGIFIILLLTQKGLVSSC